MYISKGYNNDFFWESKNCIKSGHFLYKDMLAMQFYLCTGLTTLIELRCDAPFIFLFFFQLDIPTK